jgi:branched-chain amino acid transport system substrate-binding protein
VKFGPDGEWAQHQTVTIQFQNIKGSDVEQFRQAGKQVVIWPDQFKSGNLIYPYSAARK